MAAVPTRIQVSAEVQLKPDEDAAGAVVDATGAPETATDAVPDEDADSVATMLEITAASAAPLMTGTLARSAAEMDDTCDTGKLWLRAYH